MLWEINPKILGANHHRENSLKGTLNDQARKRVYNSLQASFVLNNEEESKEQPT